MKGHNTQENIRKNVITIFLVLLTLIFSSICCYAHSGNTDSNGGHYNQSTGEYHYHHGYPAHQHPNGVCPYDIPVCLIVGLAAVGIGGYLIGKNRKK